MSHLTDQARADRSRDPRTGRSVPALLGAAVLVLASVPALAASHGGGHSGGGHSGGSHSSGSHSSGMHAHTSVSGFHGGFRGGSTGFHSGFHGSPGFHGGFHDGRGFHGFNGRFGGFGHFGFFPRFYGSIAFTWGTPFFWGFPFDYWPYYGYYGYGWDAPYSYPGYDRGSSRDDQGALDLDLSPSDTQVYLNGEYIGVVDDFDGWPQYLWLDPGTYDIVFYHDGFKTLARQVTVYRGVVVDWTDRMERGTATRPDDLDTKIHERRDARLRQDREMQDRADRYSGDRDGDWRDRADRNRDARRHDADDQGDDDGGNAPPPPPAAHHLGRLRLEVSPNDASVYLDGRFVGTAEEVAQSGGMVVGAGDHTLSIVRPGRRSEERHFNSKAGEDTVLNIDLQRQ